MTTVVTGEYGPGRSVFHGKPTLRARLRAAWCTLKGETVVVPICLDGREIVRLIKETR